MMVDVAGLVRQAELLAAQVRGLGLGLGLGVATNDGVGGGAVAGGGGHAHATDPHEVRDPDRARYWLERIKAEVLAKYPTVEALEAAGFKPTSDVDGPRHYTRGGYTNPDPNTPDGGTTDFSEPFSVMVEDGKVVGVMLRAHGAVVPDFGAGEWHSHGEESGDDALLMHVWFDRPLDRSFGGHVPGFMPGERGELPKPGQPVPGPVPGPVPMPPTPKPLPEPLPEPTPKPLPEPPTPTPKPLPEPPNPWPPIGLPPGCGCAMPPSNPIQAGKAGVVAGDVLRRAA